MIYYSTETFILFYFLITVLMNYKILYFPKDAKYYSSTTDEYLNVYYRYYITLFSLLRQNKLFKL